MSVPCEEDKQPHFFGAVQLMPLALSRPNFKEMCTPIVVVSLRFSRLTTPTRLSPTIAEGPTARPGPVWELLYCHQNQSLHCNHNWNDVQPRPRAHPHFPPSCRQIHPPPFTETNSQHCPTGSRCGIQTLRKGSTTMSRSVMLATCTKGRSFACST